MQNRKFSAWSGPPKAPIELVQWWTNEALKVNRELELSPNIVEESASIVYGAMSFEWFEKEIRRPRQAPVPHSNVHPLIHWFEVPNNFNVCSIVELARCLKKLHTISGFSTIIPNLRDPEGFASAFLQLAKALRFQSMGVENLLFEPDTDNGRKGDILFTDQGQTIVCECFVPRFRREKAREEFVRNASKVAFEAAKRREKRVMLLVNLERQVEVNNQFIAEARKKIISGIERVTKDESVDLAVDGCEIKIIELSDMEEERKLCSVYQEWSTAGITVGMVKKQDIESIRRGHRVPSADKSYFLIRDPDNTTIEEVFIDLAEKVRRKVDQVRLQSDNARGLMIVESPLARPDNQFVSRENRDILRKKILDKYEHVAGILFSDRITTEKKRAIYSGFLMFRSTDDAMMNFSDRLNSVEQSHVHLE
ncbi:hypothetical protein [Oligoflexus tunisiensis]|uniref:hypothetical protein n=1 Tax=Oligoflexus tunisiensis TaxID=708132 RepID=UPI00114CBC85|nr:hypothetical protein [Oligoflexus tunisiensis]